MDNAQQQIVERLKEATNVLVTTSSNPTVDQLAAVIGFTLLLNKADKHATAVFSGELPSTLEFLQPEKTLEKNTDSLRDFIISLDKSKADKLRYKVEDSHVKIFITPYRTSISEKDLEFSQGDFNVDLVVLLGVHDQKDLDQAITAHGRILHDATVASIASTPGNSLGTINWVDATSSSLCEMLVALSEQIKPDGLDGQISTAFMTGIVAETERFSNEKTTATTMAVSARLMASGANQQLVASELQPKPEPVPEPPAQTTPEPPAPPKENPAEPPKPVETNDGALKVEHAEQKPVEPSAPPSIFDMPEEEEPKENKLEQIHIDEDGGLHPIAEVQDERLSAAAPTPQPPSATGLSSIMTAPPSLGGTLTASGEPGADDKAANALSLPPVGGKLLSHDAPIGSSTPSGPSPDSAKAEEPLLPVRTEDVHGHITIQPPDHHDTQITEIARQEEATQVSGSAQPSPVEAPSVTQIQDQTVVSEYTESVAPAHVNEDQAREAVFDAVASGAQPLPPPPAAFNSQPLDLDVQQRSDAGAPADQSGFPPNLVPPEATPPTDHTASPVVNPTAPPLPPPPMSPPPMMPPMPGYMQPPANPGSGNDNDPGQEPPK